MTANTGWGTDDLKGYRVGYFLNFLPNRAPV